MIGDARFNAEGGVPDVLAPGLRVLFCGINPGLRTADTGHHFAGTSNRFWPALHAAGFTPERLRPDEQRRLLDYGLGITNFVARATAAASELAADEYRQGAIVLEEKVARYSPEWVAFLGLGAYRTAYGRRGARVGAQPGHQISGARVWLLPNPSGLNAHFPPAKLAAAFAALRRAAYPA